MIKKTWVLLTLYETRKARFSVRLFQLLGAEMHIFIKARDKCAFGSAQNALRTRKCYGPQEVPKPKRTWKF